MVNLDEKKVGEAAKRTLAKEIDPVDAAKKAKALLRLRLCQTALFSIF